MSTAQDRLKAEIESYERAKEEFFRSVAGKRLTKKLAKEKEKQNNKGCCLCCCFCKRRQNTDPNAERRRLQYHEDKINEALRSACSSQLRALKETTRDIREQQSLQAKDRHLAKAHRILYAEKYRKKLVAACESQLRKKLESAIAKTYEREPLASYLHKELAQAERVLEYVTRKERQRKGSTWKFQYDPEQAGYSLSYWVGSDQHWLRNRYRKYERENVQEDETYSQSTRRSRAQDRDELNLRNSLLKVLNVAVSRRNAHDIRSVILRIDENRMREELEVEVTRAEELLAVLKKGPAEREFGDGADQEEEEVESPKKARSNGNENLRERLHAAVWCDKHDFADLREVVDLFEAANLDDVDGDLAKAHRILQGQIYAEGLRHGMDDGDVDTLKTILQETDAKGLRNEVGDIYDDAKKFLRKMAKERLLENLLSKLRQELVGATDARKAKKILTALARVREEGFEKKLMKEVNNAEKLLRELEKEKERSKEDEKQKEELERIQKEVHRLKQLLREAIDSGDASLLEAAIKSVIESGLQDMLKAELAAANEILDKLKEKVAFRKSVAEIPARYVSEVRSYQKPPAGVLEVMQATFLLLGFDEQGLKTWKSIQTHLGKGGTDSFRYRVVKRDPNVISEDVIQGAKSILGNITLDDAQNLSLLVNLFYRYCQAVINESQQPNETGL